MNNHFENSLKALEAKNRLRSRKLTDGLIDFASNDYLGFAHNKKNAKKAFNELLENNCYAPKASQLVNGYNKIHYNFEELLKDTFGFESALIFGSGYMANLALAGNLARKEDTILMDDEYHASGKAGVKLSSAKVIFFKHNNVDDLRQKLDISTGNVFVFVEGVYSMIGDILAKEIVELADSFGAYLIIDEAHSLGTIGDDLLGVYSKLNITPKPTHIKMGTFSKALGSYGAYVLCSDTISRYIQNRGSSIIYTTAPSLFDTAFAYYNFKTLLKKHIKFSKKITKFKTLCENSINIKPQSQILMVENNAKESYKKLIDYGFCVGYIRPPTVSIPALRITLRIENSTKDFKALLSTLI